MEGVADCDESEEADSEVARWGGGCASWAEGQEGMVVFADLVKEEDGGDEEEREEEDDAGG